AGGAFAAPGGLETDDDRLGLAGSDLYRWAVDANPVARQPVDLHQIAFGLRSRVGDREFCRDVRAGRNGLRGAEQVDAKRGRFQFDAPGRFFRNQHRARWRIVEHVVNHPQFANLNFLAAIERLWLVALQPQRVDKRAVGRAEIGDIGLAVFVRQVEVVARDIIAVQA